MKSWSLTGVSPTARNTLELSGNLWGLAMSTSEVFSVVEFNGTVHLSVWTLDYGKEVVSQPPRIPVGDGLGYRGPTGLDFNEVTSCLVCPSDFGPERRNWSGGAGHWAG